MQEDRIQAKEEKEARLREISMITQKLGPPDYKDDQHSTLEHCHIDSGSWILNKPEFVRWKTAQDLTNAVLYINGMPGAGGWHFLHYTVEITNTTRGKTTLASQIVNHLQSSAGIHRSPCLFFYFKHQSDTMQSFACLLRALLVQLLEEDSTLAEAFYQKYHSISISEARSSYRLKEFAAELLKSQNRCFIILDGLDECPDDDSPSEATRILKWFLTYIVSDGLKMGSNICLLVSGQRDGTLDRLLSGYPSIQLDILEDHLNDIHAFTQTRVSAIGHRFDLEPQEEAEIIKKVTATSEGMFLYTKVVMDNLMAQVSAAELDEELTVNFPKGLSAAYERVITRILDRPTRSRSQRDAAGKILNWVTCAARPLKWREIQCLLCVDAQKGSCNPRKRCADSCKDLCGSLIEADQRDNELKGTELIINIVHDTARRYLIQTERVNVIQHNADIALFSSAYLASPPFREDISDEEILQVALTGFYGFHDYTVETWQHHIRLAFGDITQLCPTICHQLRKFVGVFWTFKMSNWISIL
ncbi:hypothetical protein F5B20DRAFT_320144 [Whalleya microplaca]|nr:hypothetical protein F5B20DRAFT_320144 [Whalleya microplaca]